MKVSKFCGWAAYGLLLAGVWFSGCKTRQQFSEMPGDGAASLTSAAASGSNSVPVTPFDRISVGDNLTITFTDLPNVEPAIQQRVREDGTITLLQNQTFTAALKSRGDLEKEIRQRYVTNYYKTMTVSVSFEKNMQFYYVDGEVKRPTREVYLSRITVLKAIASANGFTDFARKASVILTRTDGSTHIVNCIKALKDPKLDLEVYPGDRINVLRKRHPFDR